MDSFMRAIKRGDGQTAYNQFSARHQRQVDKKTYINEIKIGGPFVSDYSIDITHQDATIAQASIHMVIFINGTYTANLILENNTWKIDSGDLQWLK